MTEKEAVLLPAGMVKADPGTVQLVSVKKLVPLFEVSVTVSGLRLLAGSPLASCTWTCLAPEQTLMSTLGLKLGNPRMDGGPATSVSVCPAPPAFAMST